MLFSHYGDYELTSHTSHTSHSKTPRAINCNTKPFTEKHNGNHATKTCKAYAKIQSMTDLNCCCGPLRQYFADLYFWSFEISNYVSSEIQGGIKDTNELEDATSRSILLIQNMPNCKM